MPDILEQILQKKKQEVAEKKMRHPVDMLIKVLTFNKSCISMKEHLQMTGMNGIIAEVKRKSPSKGVIHHDIDMSALSRGYCEAGASALSILTDQPFFGGTREDIITARAENSCPILRKDFIIDEYQIFESRAMGADVILLIAAALTPGLCFQLAGKAVSIGMEVLLEVHNEEEIRSHINEHITLIGVNNRNLKTFETSIDKSIILSDFLPTDILRISESGIRTANDIIMLRNHGFSGFLIGETFMRSSNPAEACRQLVNELNKGYYVKA